MFYRGMKPITGTIGITLFDNMPREINKDWLIHSEDLILPDKLKKLKEWTDYVLLCHRSNKISQIKKEGIRCCSDLNPQLASLRKNVGFSNDPDLIYFRPISPHGIYKPSKDNICIAVPKERVRVFNQEERVTQNFAQYCGKSMPVEDYDNLISKLQPNEYLRGDGSIVPYDRLGDYYYLPEVCFDNRYISPEYFINK